MSELITTQRKNTFVTEGPIHRVTLRLSLPIAASMIMEFALAFTDFFFIGQLGARQQDSLTTSLIVVWTTFSIVTLITIGVNAIVARHYGANDTQRAGAMASQGIKFAFLLSLVVAVLGVLTAKYALVFMDAEPQVTQYGAEYLEIFFLAAPLLFFVETMSAIYRATGDTKRPMIVALTGVGLNIILDPILIFGWGPAPELGVAGAALGTLLSLFVDVALFVFFIWRDTLTISLKSLKTEKLRWLHCISIAKIGLPIATQHLVFLLVYTFLLQIVHRFGHVAGAAMGVGNRFESINYLCSTAIGLASSAIVGQCLGALKPDRAAKAAWVACLHGIIFTGVTSSLFMLFPNTLAGVLTNDPEVMDAARDYLLIVGASQIFMAIEIIIDSSFSGAGDTIPPMLVSIPGSIARIPIAYFLAVTLEMGVVGVWWAIASTTILKSIALAIWFRTGRWKTKQV